MKALMILGAVVGFLIGSAFGLAGRTSWPAALWHACAAALVAALLARWWAGVWIRGLHDAHQQKRVAAAAAAANAAKTNTAART